MESSTKASSSGSSSRKRAASSPVAIQRHVAADALPAKLGRFNSVKRFMYAQFLLRIAIRLEKRRCSSTNEPLAIALFQEEGRGILQDDALVLAAKAAMEARPGPHVQPLLKRALVQVEGEAASSSAVVVGQPSSQASASARGSMIKAVMDAELSMQAKATSVRALSLQLADAAIADVRQRTQENAAFIASFEANNVVDTRYAR